jgi:hypothetical protein
MSDEKPDTRIVDTWIREEQFTKQLDMQEIISYVRSQKSSGQLVFDIHQGGMRAARFVKTIPAEVEL